MNEGKDIIAASYLITQLL